MLVEITQTPEKWKTEWNGDESTFPLEMAPVAIAQRRKGTGGFAAFRHC